MIGLPACTDHSSQELVQPGTRATDRDSDEIYKPENARQNDEQDERPSPPIVEERLLVCIDVLKCLQRLSRLAEQPNNIPQLSALYRFARMTNQFARAVEGHLKAVTLVLPVTATNLPAPDERERV